MARSIRYTFFTIAVAAIAIWLVPEILIIPLTYRLAGAFGIIVIVGITELIEIFELIYKQLKESNNIARGNS